MNAQGEIRSAVIVTRMLTEGRSIFIVEETSSTTPGLPRNFEIHRRMLNDIVDTTMRSAPSLKFFSNYLYAHGYRQSLRNFPKNCIHTTRISYEDNQLMMISVE